MKMKLLDLLNEHDILLKDMTESMYGIEKECLRINEEGDTLALTDHPEILGDRSFHPYIQTDYSESQPELITPAFDSIEKALTFLKAVNDVLYRSLPENEYLWPYSIPAHLPPNEDIPITKGMDKETEAYREQTGEKYGRARQLMSGIHLNFSLSDDFIDHLFEIQDHFETKKMMKNHLYLKISRHFLSYQWILTYLFGATPVAQDSYFASVKLKQGEQPEDPMRSIRNSDYGFFNDTDVNVRYDEVENYIYDIKQSVIEKRLSAEREFYSNVRLKGFGKQLEYLVTNGIKYLEFRSLDLNPFSPVGITQEESIFLDAFLHYLLLKEGESTLEEASMGIIKSKKTAMEHPHESSQFFDEATELLEDMKSVYEKLGKTEFIPPVERAIEQFNDPRQTVSGRMLELIGEEMDYITLNRKLAMEYKKEAIEEPFELDSIGAFSKEEKETIFNMIQQGESFDKLETYLYKN